ncbi:MULTISPECIES: DUF4062 domain-containing protein [Acinetobacter]|uniref:DUF4062 domain-containing protein n=1 Tax=Acinetobacter TaxID=469 RepID=UPI0007783884|nr:DUF4062 domain-containing protein [Acinetobacter venetianus]KXZ67331.1 hypothetical protein AVENLUH7437_00343 [Acinetobacter venetianus]RZG80814.1 DUF4062 domain-containing protein [Acinetobacter venetianus]
MDKRYQVFVSSTFKDLEEERKHIIQTLMEMDCIPAGMELFPAADEEQWDFIKKVIDDCDYYLLLIGGRYGSLSPEGIGYTEMEYNYAVSKGMKVIALVHGEPNNLAQIKCERDPHLQEKLEQFRARVCTGRLVKFWKNSDQISGIVSLSLSKTIKTYPAIGWVRANLVPSEDTAKEILKLRNEITILENKIQNLKSRPEGIENLSQGEDTFNIRINFSAKKTNEIEFSSHEIVLKITWNNVFSFISPMLLDECTQENLNDDMPQIIKVCGKKEINSYISDNNLNSERNFYLYKNDFNMILVQFRALKLIELSTKKHPPSDKNIYWTLTSYGDQLMTQLTAITK